MKCQYLLRGLVAASALALAGCGEYVREQGRSPVQPVIVSLQASPGGLDEFGGTLHSDVETGGGVINDSGQVIMAAVLKDQGAPGATASPSALNQITFTRYRVVYRRTDGRDRLGVDVPFPFDSGLTFTVAPGAQSTAGFDIVRHTAKREAPLAGLANNTVKIDTIAEVTFFGRDLAGNDVAVTGSIGIIFGQFADPE